jgi:hypothetical protein
MSIFFTNVDLAISLDNKANPAQQEYISNFQMLANVNRLLAHKLLFKW